MPTIKTDKQILIDWYFQMVADSCGPHAEIFIPQGSPVEQDFTYKVQNVVAYRSNG